MNFMYGTFINITIKQIEKPIRLNRIDVSFIKNYKQKVSKINDPLS
jgi:hypothetical protein